MTIWHPFTQMKTAPVPLKVKSGRGAVLTLDDGRELIDCISSWWVNVLGHSHPEIAEAIYHQANTLEHVIFAGFTHEPAEKLSSKLTQLLPLSKVFFSDNGSTAVEVAIKLAYQYWKNLGVNNRNSFLCFNGGYHGDTFGSMSLGGKSSFTKVFDDLLFDVHVVPYPTKSDDVLKEIENQLETKKFAGIVIEPLVQGANGMQMCSCEFLQQLEKLAHHHETLLIYDEVMTGFGRTGDWFACRKSNTLPDIICLSKGITGGFLPLAVTICSEKIYQAFYSEEIEKTFWHGHSYTANPLGCAAAVATLDLLEKNEHLFKGMEQKHRYYSKYLNNVSNLRFCGTIMAFDILTNEESGYFHSIGKTLKQKFIKKGMLIRPLGNTIYLMPPYCITDDQLEYCYKTIGEII